VDDAVRLCPGEGVTEYFRELVDDVAGQQRLGLDPMTSYYVVQLLATFARTDADACDAFWTGQPMGALLGEAIAAGGSEQRRRLRKVGDASLVLSGLFPNRLRRSLVDVRSSGAITIDRAGELLAPIAEMAALGVVIFTDDGTGVQDDRLMRRALEYAVGLGVTLAQHCEVSRLTEGAVMHEGACCSHLGLPGWPSIAEELMVFRDIELKDGSRVARKETQEKTKIAIGEVVVIKVEDRASTALVTYSDDVIVLGDVVERR